MAKTNIYDDKKLRYVDLIHPTNNAANWLYFFKTNVDLAAVSDLGQTEVTATVSLLKPAIAGTRRPTPLAVRNAKKRITSLCSSSKFPTANIAGWKRINNPTFAQKRLQTVPPTAGVQGAILVSVPCATEGGTINFGWFMQNQQFLKISDAERTSLGIAIPTTDADWERLALGCNRVRPPRARKTTFGGANATVVGGSDSTETFYDAVGGTLPDGWTHSANAVAFSF